MISERDARFARHVLEVAAAFHVRVVVDPTLPPHGARAGETGQRTSGVYQATVQKVIVISPVIDETTYAVALHELGHCIDPVASCRYDQGSAQLRQSDRLSTRRDVLLQLEEERAAWRWAKHAALEWTPPMQQVAVWSLGAYKRRAQMLVGRR